MTDLPEYIWGATFIMGHIQHAIEKVESIKASCHEHVNIPALAALVQMPELYNIRSENTKWIQIAANGNDAIRLIFKATVPSKDTRVIKVEAFDTWRFSKNRDPELLTYVGPKHILFNGSSNCIKALPELPDTNIVNEQCKKKEFIDPLMKNQWKVVRSTKDITQEPQVTEYRDGGNNVWVRCYPGWIMVSGKNSTCPYYVFSIPYGHGFETSDKTFTPIVTKEEVYIEPAVALRFATNFVHGNDSDEFDVMAEYQKLRQANEVLQQLKKSDTTEVMPTQWVLITIVTISLAGLLGTAGYLLINKSTCKTTRNVTNPTPITNGPVVQFINSKEDNGPFVRTSDPAINI